MLHPNLPRGAAACAVNILFRPPNNKIIKAKIIKHI